MMDRNKIRKLTASARIQSMRAEGKTVTEIIKATGLNEREVIEHMNVNNSHATNNRPPRSMDHPRSKRRQ